MKTIRITSLDQTGLEPYRTLRRPVEHHQKGIFVAEGEKVVRRLLESPIVVLSALVTPEWLDRYRDAFASRVESVYIADKKAS